jgi:hypothetical protein
MYMLFYASMLRSWHLVWILVRTDHPCLGVGCHKHLHSRSCTVLGVGETEEMTDRVGPHVNRGWRWWVSAGPIPKGKAEEDEGIVSSLIGRARAVLGAAQGRVGVG